MHGVIEAAGAWFLNSGIQENTGGFARYYRSAIRENARTSTEITGYSLSALLFLYQRSGRTDYLDAALRAARFLTRTAWNRQLRTFPFEYSAGNGSLDGYAYFFDCGIIVRGLLAAWYVTREAEFRETAIAAGCSMLADFRAAETIHPILSLPGKTPLAYGNRWSNSPGCYQLKSAMAWHDLYECSGDIRYLRAYESVLEPALAGAPSFLPGTEHRHDVMDRLHPHTYFLEGLLPVLDRPDCAAAFRAGIDRTAAFLRDIATEFVRSDVYAQLLRVRLCGASLGVVPLDEPAAAHEAEQLAGFQLHSQDSRLSGGFEFGRKLGAAMQFANPVSTAFALQALAWWSDYQHNKLETSRQALI